MKMSVHLNFNGNCREAFALYQKVFGTKSQMLMTFGEAPGGAPVPPDMKDKVMHTSIAMGEGMLMGCDTPPDRSTPIGGFQISVQSTDQAEVKRVSLARRWQMAEARSKMPVQKSVLVSDVRHVHGQVRCGLDGGHARRTAAGVGVDPRLGSVVELSRRWRRDPGGDDRADRR